jgi:hypothetical protein
MLVGTVLLAFVRQPMSLPDGQHFFVLELRRADGRGHDLFSRTQPDIFGPDGQTMTLAAEIGARSRIKVDDHGRTMRAVQVIELRTVNPFAQPRRCVKLLVFFVGLGLSKAIDRSLQVLHLISRNLDGYRPFFHSFASNAAQYNPEGAARRWAPPSTRSAFNVIFLYPNKRDRVVLRRPRQPNHVVAKLLPTNRNIPHPPPLASITQRGCACVNATLVPPVIDFAVNLRIDSSVTTEILRDRETNCCEKVCGEA